MEAKHVAGAWVAGVAILASCLASLSLLSSDSQANGQPAQVHHSAPMRISQSRNWLEATGSLPARTTLDHIYDDDDDDINAVIEPPIAADLFVAHD
jgi:hypothetical protein